MSHPDPEVAGLVEQLGLAPHPEGGFYRETFRDAATDESGRARCTLIYFLLAEGQRSHWHRVDASEIWLWHAGDALALTTADEAGARTTVQLGPDLAAGQSPQAVVPAHAWQMAEPIGAWTLVSCVVAPGFEFDRFELAPEGWRPGT